MTDHSASRIPARVQALDALYSDPHACLAYLLCDRHEPGSTAYRIVGEDGSVNDLSYAQLRDESERFAAALISLGIGTGDRVATLMGKSRLYVVTLLAIWRLGAVHVPLFTAFAPAAIALRLEGSKAKAVVCDPPYIAKLQSDSPAQSMNRWKTITTGPAGGDALAFRDLLAAAKPGLPAVSQGGAAPCIQIYTSGTTGRPKGVVVPVRAFGGFQAYAEFGHGLRSDDVFWCAADPGWAYGLYFGIVATLSTGVPGILLSGGFSPESTWRTMIEQRVTVFAAAPTVYRALRTSMPPPRESLRLRAASSAGEPLTPDVNMWAAGVLGVPVHDHYGQTETGMLINNHQHPSLASALRPGSMGRAAPGWSLTVLEGDSDVPAPIGTRGRIAVEIANSPFAWFNGYADDDGRTTEKFTRDRRWYLTGDLGHVDADGHFFFASRDDDLILMAGYRISPQEVEAVLLEHPAIAECAVYAIPDEVRGEVLLTAVVLHVGFKPSPALAEELQHWVKDRYAAHAFPRAVRFIDALPRTPSGKLQRFVLKQNALAAKEQPAGRSDG